MIEIPEKLRELRKQSGLSQDQVATKSGVGVKTLSSFESGARVKSMKLEQLAAICAVYGITLGEFFGNDAENFTTSPLQNAFFDLLSEIFDLPEPTQQQLLAAFRHFVAGASTVAPEVRRTPVDPLEHTNLASLSEAFSRRNAA